MKDCRICGKIGYEQDMTSNGYYHKNCYYQKYKHTINKKKNDYTLPSYYGQVDPNPGVFYNDAQEKEVAAILRAIGWKRSQKGIWYDDKIKSKTGEWLIEFSEPSPLKVKYTDPSKYLTWIQENNIDLPKIRYKNRKPYFTNQEIDDIQDQYFNHRVTAKYLAHKYECNIKEVKYVIHRTYRLIKHQLKNEKT